MNKKISVAMATYNGCKYIKEQIDSILICLDFNDELIISDDGSTDNTLQIISEYNDSRIKLIEGPKKGIIANFENAIIHCSGEYIFLSDQDDVWHTNKVAVIVKEFENSNCSLILHNANIYDNRTKTIQTTTKDKIGFRKTIFGNIIKNSFIGCCIAFKKESVTYFYPFPSKEEICIHDWWIGLNCLKKGSVRFIDEPLINYRIHENNNLGFHKTSFKYKIVKRINMLSTLKKGFKNANNKKDL